ncbi:MAG: hypothetical protein ISS19_14095 [Bacteroidales bacterium]|nr:hypothetical protein [Bacteroidales bacterium]
MYTLPDFTFIIPFAAESGYIKDLTAQEDDEEFHAEPFLMYETDLQAGEAVIAFYLLHED